MTKSVRLRMCSSGMLAVSVLAAAVASGPTGSAAVSGPCGSVTPPVNSPPSYSQIVVVMEDNVSYPTFLDTGDAPYLHGLASQCGSETFMHAAIHPSQPNYMAVTSGTATAVGVHTVNDNIFRQAQAHGDTWKAYEDSVPANYARNTSRAPRTVAITTSTRFSETWRTFSATPRLGRAVGQPSMRPGLGF